MINWLNFPNKTEIGFQKDLILSEIKKLLEKIKNEVDKK